MHLVRTVLVGIGLAALALSAPTDAGSSVLLASLPATSWMDTQMQKYHCAGKDILCCEVTAGGSCVAMESCELHCSEHEGGAVCVDTDKGIVSDREKLTPESQVSMHMTDKITPRDASPQEDKHYVCSKDRKGVLICRFGFCSTDYYCRSNEECNDRSVSCESKVLYASKSEIRAMTNGPETAPLKSVPRSRTSKEKSSYVCSKDRASVLKCTYGFCATDYYCAKGHPCVDNPARCKKAKQFE